eukprot:EG_transcript_19617
MMYTADFHHLVMERVLAAVDLRPGLDDAQCAAILQDLRQLWQAKAREARRGAAQRSAAYHVVGPTKRPRGGRPTQPPSQPPPADQHFSLGVPRRPAAPGWQVHQMLDPSQSSSSRYAPLPYSVPQATGSLALGVPKAIVRLPPDVIDVDDDDLDWEGAHRPCANHPLFQRLPLAKAPPNPPKPSSLVAAQVDGANGSEGELEEGEEMPEMEAGDDADLFAGMDEDQLLALLAGDPGATDALDSLDSLDAAPLHPSPPPSVPAPEGSPLPPASPSPGPPGPPPEDDSASPSPPEDGGSPTDADAGEEEDCAGPSP